MDKTVGLTSGTEIVFLSAISPSVNCKHCILIALISLLLVWSCTMLLQNKNGREKAVCVGTHKRPRRGHTCCQCSEKYYYLWMDSCFVRLVAYFVNEMTRSYVHRVTQPGKELWPTLGRAGRRIVPPRGRDDRRRGAALCRRTNWTNPVYTGYGQESEANE